MKLSFEAVLALLDKTFTKDMPFMQQFSASLESFDEKSVSVKFAMSDKLIGNMHSKILHGGAIASMLDSVGGMLTMAAVFAKHPEDSEAQQLKRLTRTATVNLLINYLRPGRGHDGDFFHAEANVVHCGARITVCELRLKNKLGELLATGTGTYMNGN